MDFAFAALGLLSGLILIYWVGFRTRRGVPADRTAPPLAVVGAERLPVLGMVLRLRNLVADPVGLTVRAFRAYGTVFTLRIPLYKKPYFDLTYLADEAGYRRVLELDPDVGTLGFVMGNIPAIGLWFPRTPRDDAGLQELVVAGRRFIRDQILREGRLVATNEALLRAVEEHADEWDESVDLAERFVELVHDVCGRAFGGDALWDDAGASLRPLLRCLADGIDVVRVTLALHHPIRRLMPEYRATRALEAVFARLIEEHDRSGRYPLVEHIRGIRVNGEPLDEANVPWMLLFVLWNALTYPGSYGLWTLTDILARPTLVERLRQAPDRAARLELLEACFLETARLNPVSSLPRMLSRPIEFESEGRRWWIPAGGYVAAFPGGLNQDPEVFSDPTRWDPDRHHAGSTATPYIFGHGPFSCVARAFVLSTLPAILDELLMGWDLHLRGEPPERIVRVHLTYSKHPIRATVRRRTESPGGPSRGPGL